MSACAPRDPGVEALSSASGAALPFLPTLVTAIVVACASLLCRTPSAPETPALPVATVQTSAAGADGFHPAVPLSDASPTIPAVLAFSRLHPLPLQAHLADADEGARAPAQRAARLAVAARRPCASPRCGEARRTETAARVVPAPVKSASEPAAILAPTRGQAEADEDLLPTGALPFAATAASLVEKVSKLGGSVGSGAASLGGSVVELLASTR